jgi:hypothetical protein
MRPATSLAIITFANHIARRVVDQHTIRQGVSTYIIISRQAFGARQFGPKLTEAFLSILSPCIHKALAKTEIAARLEGHTVGVGIKCAG